jgi:hypothetical protein
MICRRSANSGITAAAVETIFRVMIEFNEIATFSDCGRPRLVVGQLYAYFPFSSLPAPLAAAAKHPIMAADLAHILVAQPAATHASTG